MRAADLNRKLSPKEFIKQRLKVKKLVSGQPLRVHGLDGYTGLAAIKGKPARISVIYLRDQAFVFFSGVKDNQYFEQFDTEFLATAKSLHRLRKDEQHLAKALSLDIVTVDRADNYASWSRKSYISNSPLLQLKLLNAHYPHGELKAGSLAKQVR